MVRSRPPPATVREHRLDARRARPSRHSFHCRNRALERECKSRYRRGCTTKHGREVRGEVVAERTLSQLSSTGVRKSGAVVHCRGGVWRRIEVRTADDERNLDQHDIGHQIGDVDRDDDEANDDADDDDDTPRDDANDDAPPDDDTWHW